MADARITTTFRIVGEDAASAQINNVRGNISKLGPVLSGVGSIAASEFTKMGQGATLLSGVMNLIPGPMGLIASAAVGAATAIFAMAKNSQSALDVELQRLDVAMSDARLLAERYGINADLLNLNDNQLKTSADLSALLKEVGKEEERLLNMRKSGEEDVNNRQAIRVSSLRAEAVVMQEQVDLSNKRLQSEIRLRSLSLKYSNDLLEREAKTALIQDKKDRAIAEEKIRVEKIQEARTHMARLQNEQVVGAEAVATQEDKISEAKRAIIALEAQQWTIAEKGASATERRAKATVQIAKAVKEEKSDVMSIWDIYRQLEEFDKKSAEIDAQPGQQVADSEAELQRARLAIIGDAAAQEELIRMDLADRTKAIQQQVIDGTLNEAAAENMRVSAVIAAEDKIAKVRDEEAKKQKEALLEQAQMYLKMGGSAVQALEVMGVGERKLAGIKAVMAVGEGLLAAARGDWAGAAAGAASAIQFGAIAFGVGGGSSAPASSAGGGASAPGQYASSASSAGAGGGGNITVVLQGGAVIGTPQAVGQYVQKALGSLSGSGITAAAGV